MDFTCKKTTRTREEMLSYFDKCDQQILEEACRIQDEGSASSTKVLFEDHDHFECAVTSTPNHKRSAKSRTINASKQNSFVFQKNVDDVDSNVLSVSKVLAIVENIRKDDAVAKRKAAIIAREEQMLQDRAAHEAQLQSLSQSKALRIQEEQLRLLKEEETLAAERKQRQKLEQQKHAQRVSLRHEQIKAAEHQKREAEAEHRKKAAERLKCAEEVQQQLGEFATVFNKIHAEFKLCQALSPLVTEVKPLNNGMQSLIHRMKAIDVNKNDVEAAKNICSKLNSIYSKILEEVAKIKKQEVEREQIKQQELEQLQIQSNQRQELTTSAESSGVKDSTSAGELSDCADKESLLWYQELKKLKQDNEKSFEQLLHDDRLKKYRFDCQKAVNIPVNAISCMSASHLRDKLQKLTHLISGQPVVVGDGVRVSAAQHPAGIAFCKDLLAKKFVKQGASTVSSKPEAAFAIAAVMVAIWQEFPDWGQLLLAHFHHDCPYLVPIFWPQLEGQTNKDYYLSLGYTYNEDGEVEKQDKFLKRMSGIMRLYAAVLITRLPRDRQSRPHPHDLGQGWRWLTSLLNLEPRPDICASLLYDFLEITGSSMLEQYGLQYRKLLLVICKGYFPRLQKAAVSSSGPIVRLETYLQTILKQGSKLPQGVLPPNFW